MAESEEPAEGVTVPTEVVYKGVLVAMPEKVLLDMLREVTLGADPDLVYIEFFSNDSVFELIPSQCDCECNCSEESDDDCECCRCEFTDDDDDDETQA